MMTVVVRSLIVSGPTSSSKNPISEIISGSFAPSVMISLLVRRIASPMS